MANQDSEQRLAIFIDGSNLYHAMRENLHRVDLNFAEFARKLCGSRNLLRIYYYNASQDPSLNPEAAREQQEFLDTLRRTPYMEVRLGRTRLQQGVAVEKGVDIMLATDLVQFALSNTYDVAVLVSGDGDFAYAVQTVKNTGKHVEVAYFENNTSRDLLDVSDYTHLLDREFFKALWKTPERRRRRGWGHGSGHARGE